jgi:hypothetical protein
VMLYTDGGVPPADNECDNRKVGAFWWHKARHITINVTRFTLSTPGGLLSGRNLTIGGAALAGGVGLAVLGGGDSTPSVTPPGGGNTGGGTGGGGSVSFSFFNRAWRNQMTLQQDGCGGFTSSPLTLFTVTVDPNTGTGTAIHAHPSATLNYNTVTSTRTSDSAGTLTGSGTTSFGAQTFSLSITLVVSGTTGTVTEILTRTAGGPACTVRYTGPSTAQ